MPRSYKSLTLEDAKQMLLAAEAKAAGLGVAYNLAVVDAGGHLLAFVRQDGALIPRLVGHDLYAQSRIPMDMIFQG